jgi:hypothetical protein
MNDPVETFYIGDTQDGKVFVSITPAMGLVIGPLQRLIITGKGSPTMPQRLMTRREFKIWREAMQNQGFTIELRFES